MADPADKEFCLTQVRRFDRDRYLTGLFAKGQDRSDLMALFAFNVEVARTRELVREPMMGLIRLQWWRDAVMEIYAGQQRRHQVVQPLAEAIRRCGLSRGHFLRLLEGREADLDPAPPKNLAALMDYAEGTSASLTSLSLEILVSGTQPPAAEIVAAARLVGTAWALTGLLRAIPFHARSRRVMLPQTMLSEVGLTETDSFDLKPSAALSGAVATIAREARQCLGTARLHRIGVPKRCRPAFLLAVLAADNLRRLERAGYNPFDPRVQESPPGRVWRLAPAALLGRF